MHISENLKQIRATLPPQVTLVAVSKTKPVDALMEAYEAGQRIFGENKIQEMVAKYQSMPADVEWHMIGHVQTNKVKLMAPFVDLIHGVDSLKLLEEINRQAEKNGRVIDCLLQVHIATEETKFGFDADEVSELLSSKFFSDLRNVKVKGLMGMATFTENESIIQTEFAGLKSLYDRFHQHGFSILSMGMSGDYKIAIAQGSTMVRIGSSIFGSR